MDRNKFHTRVSSQMFILHRVQNEYKSTNMYIQSIFLCSNGEWLMEWSPFIASIEKMKTMNYIRPVIR